MKKISLVQVNFNVGPTNCQSYYLPYSIGCLWAYSNSFESIRNNFQLEHVLFKRDDVDQTAYQLQHQDIVGFSCYVWNRNYNYALARKIKQLNPKFFIFFGGPEPAHTRPDFFNLHPYIDAVIIHEGEIVFKNLLENLNDPSVVQGLIYNQKGNLMRTSDPGRLQDLSTLS